MNCPNCGTREQARIKVCPHCGIAYASQDLLELRQLEFLLQETASWEGSESKRDVYAERLKAQRARLLPSKETQTAVTQTRSPVEAIVLAPLTEKPPVKAALVNQAGPKQVIQAAKPGPLPKPKAEPVPFDQWLLSERNIKFALYTGGLLLVISGLIFVGANWARIPGPVKFAILLAITAGMYLGGAVLYKRPSLRLGGVALLAVASGFFLLDFVVLQIYVFRGLGLDDRVMWLICSLAALPVYFLTASKTRATLFSFLSIAAAASAVTAGMALLKLPDSAYVLVYACLAIVLLWVASVVRSSKIANFTLNPLWIVSQMAVPLLFVYSLNFFFISFLITSWGDQIGNRWMLLAAMLAGVIFYALTDRLFQNKFAFWLVTFGFAITLTCTLVQVEMSISAICLSLMLLSLAYLLWSFNLSRKRRQLVHARPFLVCAQMIAPLIFLASLVFWITTGWISGSENPWLFLGAMLGGVLFYVLTDLLYQELFARWVAAIAFPVTFLGMLLEMNAWAVEIPLALMLLAISYLFAGAVIASKSSRIGGAQPLLVVAQVTAPLMFLAGFLLWTAPGLGSGMGSPWLALAAMLAVVLFYALTDLLYQKILARWAASVLFPVTFFCLLLELNLPLGAILIALMFLAIAYLIYGFAISSRARPFVVVAQVITPLLFLASWSLWLNFESEFGSPWIVLATMLSGVIFYVISDLLFHEILARWVAGIALAVTVLCTLVQLDFSLRASSFTILFLAIGFLLMGWYLRLRTHQLNQALPLYSVGYALALIATFQVGYASEQNMPLLAQILIGDVILLAISTVIHRQEAWAYGGAWLFITPVAIYAQVYLSKSHQISLALSGLMLVYAVTVYGLGRRYMRLAYAFLSAAAFLSLVVVPLVWVNSPVSSLILGVITLLYLLFALWLGWVWLLVPALIAFHLAVFKALESFYVARSPVFQTLILAYASLAVIGVLTMIRLQRRDKQKWVWPLLLFIALDGAGAYAASLVIGGWLPIALSTVYAFLAFWLAWEERRFLAKVRLPELGTIFGVFFVFCGHFYILAYAGVPWTAWPPFTAAVCALLVVFSWIFKRGMQKRIFGTSLHRLGLVLMLIPLLWISIGTNTGLYHLFAPAARSNFWPHSILQLITFAIASGIYFADGAIRRNPILVYLGGVALVVALWSGLTYFRISEPQAYVLPLGLGMILVGWNERRLGHHENYRWATLSGLLLLMGSAFYQSIESPVYAALLLVESVLALSWGIHLHSRGYVIVGGAALVINALVQLGPAFIELDRWIQIGVIGSLLLGGGLLALFRRDQIIAARQHFTEDWKRWQP